MGQCHKTIPVPTDDTVTRTREILEENKKLEKATFMMTQKYWKFSKASKKWQWIKKETMHQKNVNFFEAYLLWQSVCVKRRKNPHTYYFKKFS